MLISKNTSIFIWIFARKITKNIVKIFTLKIHFFSFYHFKKLSSNPDQGSSNPDQIWILSNWKNFGFCFMFIFWICLCRINFCYCIRSKCNERSFTLLAKCDERSVVVRATTRIIKAKICINFFLTFSIPASKDNNRT